MKKLCFVCNQRLFAIIIHTWKVQIFYNITPIVNISNISHTEWKTKLTKPTYTYININHGIIIGCIT